MTAADWTRGNPARSTDSSQTSLPARWTPDRPFPRRACTATSGAATSCGARDGHVWLIDPAAHGGHPESDLAMLALFGVPHLDRIISGFEETTDSRPDVTILGRVSAPR